MKSFLFVFLAVLLIVGVAGCKKKDNNIAAIEIIVDNTDSAFTVVSGFWGTCDCTACGGQCHGTDFRYANPRAAGDTTVNAVSRFTISVAETGDYQVFIWWPRGADRATAAPVRIYHSEGTFETTVDLRNNGDKWHSLGTFKFTGGFKCIIEFDDSDTGFVNADGARLRGVR